MVNKLICGKQNEAPQCDTYSTANARPQGKSMDLASQVNWKLVLAKAQADDPSNPSHWTCARLHPKGKTGHHPRKIPSENEKNMN
jgi:hypothetical protein